MKAITTNQTNTIAQGSKDFSFVEKIPAQKETIILNQAFTEAHIVHFELEPDEIEAIKNGHKEIVLTCIGFLPIINIGLEPADLDSFKRQYLEHQLKNPK